MENLENQRWRVLEFLEKRPQGVTTGELQALPYCAGGRQRISELRKMGAVIDCQPIPNSNSSRYVLVSRPETLTTLPKARRKEGVLLTTLPQSKIEVWSK